MCHTQTKHTNISRISSETFQTNYISYYICMFNIQYAYRTGICYTSRYMHVQLILIDYEHEIRLTHTRAHKTLGVSVKFIDSILCLEAHLLSLLVLQWPNGVCLQSKPVPSASNMSRIVRRRPPIVCASVHCTDNVNVYINVVYIYVLQSTQLLYGMASPQPIRPHIHTFIYDSKLDAGIRTTTLPFRNFAPPNTRQRKATEVGDTFGRAVYRVNANLCDIWSCVLRVWGVCLSTPVKL